MATAIYTVLYTKLNTIFATLKKVKVVYDYPTTQISRYPAIVFYPSSFENKFESTGSNFKIYGFKIFVIVNAGNKDVEDIYNTILPNAVDEVLEAIDNGWDFETINGHRVWTKVETGGWFLSEENAGIEATAEIDLTVKMLTNVS